MSFDQKSADLAKDIMNQINPNLSDKFEMIILFLVHNPGAASKVHRKSNIEIGSEEYIRQQAGNFIRSREPRAPSPPSTIPDEIISLIINKYFDVPKHELERAVELHNLSMGAENLVGDILERYIASIVENYGWVWCSGSMIKAVDFIYRKPDGSWSSLQVKNRDNTENSSSSAIREGTEINKWFRTFSKKKGDNWEKFPKIADANLSEEGFRRFVEEYLISLKNSDYTKLPNLTS